MREVYSVRNVERLVEVEGDDIVVLLPRFDVSISPGNSQDYQRDINRSIDSALSKRLKAIHEICPAIVRELARNIPDIEWALVEMQAEYVVFRRTPITGHETQEMFRVLGKAELKAGKIKNMIGAEVTGITACPCAHEGVVEKAKERLKEHFDMEDVTKILSTVPLASHNQRNVSTLLIEIPEGKDIKVEEIIEVLELSMSSRLYEVLKREDEVEVVFQAHLNPNFVEDTVRKILINALRKFPWLSEDSEIFARSESMESIHQHNAIAECRISAGELRSRT